MTIFVLFAFLAGVVTILSPCILPILPVILSGGLGGGKRRPLGIVVGFVLSFSFFTLALATIVRMTGVSADILRSVAIVVIFLFGLSLLLASFQVLMERLFSKLSTLAPQGGEVNNSGFAGGAMLGASLGLIWTPCVGPIIASVITLAATSMVNLESVFITFAYAAGTAIPMLAIIYGGRNLLQRVPWLLANTVKIQQAFGVLMILVAVGIYFNLDRKFQVYILDKFPQYGTGLTSIEDNPLVREQLKNLQGEAPLAQREAPELIAGGDWFNSSPLTLTSLRGRVVVVDFWTYTCINCIRTLPYLKSWHEKYADKGLVIIGVHTPEFEFEKDADNVKKAIEDFGIEYAVMQDNDYATWRAYNNRYWPAKYFIDKDGWIRSMHFGEGGYDESEELIQQLLAETGADVGEMAIDNPEYTVEARTPETYLGYFRVDNFASPETIQSDKPVEYSQPASLRNNQFAFDGVWTVSAERAQAEAGSRLLFNFEAKDVFLVIRSTDGLVGRVKIFLDGQETGVLEVDDDRLYQLIKLEKAGRHLLRLEFLDSNLELYAFTFG